MTGARVLLEIAHFVGEQEQRSEKTRHDGPGDDDQSQLARDCKIGPANHQHARQQEDRRQSQAP